MPPRPRDGVGRAERFAHFLRLLCDEGGSASAAVIQSRIRSYEGDSGARKYREDLEELVRRGVVHSHAPMGPRHATIRLIETRKRESEFLTRNEHRAIVATRTALGFPWPRLRPLDAGKRDLGSISVLLRYLEENAERDIPFWEVEEAVGLRHDALADLLDQIRRLYDGDDGESPPWIEYEVVLDEPEASWVRYDEVFEPDEPLHIPRQGSDAVSCFAYTAEETVERLRVIEGGLGSGAVDDATKSLLRSARVKLRLWLRHLDEH